MTARDRLIFALDVDHVDEAERLVRVLAPHVGLFKVGPKIFTRSGSLIVDLIHGMGASVFLDLKLHDIPATVAGAAKEIAKLRVRMFTVHGLGGSKMIQMACEKIASMTLEPGAQPPLMLAVTILTSHSPQDLEALGLHGTVVEHVERLAKLAVASGAAGIVASGQEVRALRPQLPEDTVFVTPGIRGPKDEIGDQARVMTPRQAIEAGATYLVVGRPILRAPDPVEAAKRILADIEEAID